MLFQTLRDQNTDSIKTSGVKRIVTADPHAYNALKHDYKDVPPVEHISQLLEREVKAGRSSSTRLQTKTRCSSITILAISGATTRFTTIRARCWMRSPN